ncbi:Hypothetical protein FKW44_009770, partial [Caligus rogercresseyi]
MEKKSEEGNPNALGENDPEEKEEDSLDEESLSPGTFEHDDPRINTGNPITGGGFNRPLQYGLTLI